MKQKIPSTADVKSHSSPYIKLPIKFPSRKHFLWMYFVALVICQSLTKWDTRCMRCSSHLPPRQGTYAKLNNRLSLRSRGKDKILLFQAQSWIWLMLRLASPCLTGGDEMGKKLWVADGCKLKAGSGSPLSVPIFTEAASTEWMLIRNCAQP